MRPLGKAARDLGEAVARSFESAFVEIVLALDPERVQVVLAHASLLGLTRADRC
jgi:hypothetical protein